MQNCWSPSNGPPGFLCLILIKKGTPYAFAGQETTDILFMEESYQSEEKRNGMNVFFQLKPTQTPQTRDSHWKGRGPNLQVGLTARPGSAS